MSIRRPLATATVLTLAALGTGGASLAPVFAAGSGTNTGDVAVTNTETVQIYTNADAKVDSKRVYEQLLLAGHGSVDLRNPVSTDDLRNLDGFGSLSVQGGAELVDTSVDGFKTLRTVSTYTGTSPLTVAVAYTLDGKPVKASDVVGRSGHLKVTYTVTNTSGVPTPISFDDGNGGTVTKTVDVQIPMVASLAITTPQSFHAVTSKDAQMGGDGHGGMMLSFTMTLLPPVGPATSHVSYEADITDGVIPRAELTALPVDPLQNPTFASAAKQYDSGADTGAQLTDGALKMDDGLVRLRGGASDLLAGLIQLHDGAGQLQVGLAGQAVPGSKQLATGAGQLSDGLSQLAAGGTKLKGGTQQLADGTSKALGGGTTLHAGTGAALRGGRQLAAGLNKLVGGLEKLAGNPTAPGLTSAPSVIQNQLTFLKGVQHTLGSAGDAACDPSVVGCSLIGGLAQLASTLDDASTKAADIQDGLSGLGDIKSKVDSAGHTLAGDLVASGPLDDLDTTLAQLSTDCATSSCTTAVTAMQGTAAQLRADITSATATLGDASDGLSSAETAAAAQLTNAQQLVADLDQLTKTSGTLDGLNSKVTVAIQGVLGGVVTGLTSFESSVEEAVVGLMGDPAHPHKAALLPGAKQAREGARQLANGLRKIDHGMGQLTDGLGQLDDGATQLRDGGGQLSDGLGAADAGGHQVADGAQQLADGLGPAADGAGRIDDGLGQAADGAPQIVDGARKLSTQGSQKIAEAGEQTAQQFGQMYAQLAAEATRAHTESMAYGAPDGATGLTAYDWVIQGADGDGSRERNRLLLLGGVLVAGAGGLFARRRLGR